ncbi:MAG: YabP/YqfC family sporulation protein [Clostridia bacterium]|nr:YabP/YqfC family sporulation protein [Clostridia bacterium]
MKRTKPNAFRRFLKCIDLPEFACGSDECIEIWGGNTVQVEGAKGIHTYEKEVVKLDMKNYLLVLRGSDFDLTHFGTEGLRVIGKICRIEWEEK